MSAGANEDDRTAFPRFLVEFVDQQKISADVAFAVAGPVAFQGMIKPFGAERRIIGDEQQHRLLELVEIEATGTRQAFPILGEGLGVITGARKWRPLT